MEPKQTVNIAERENVVWANPTITVSSLKLEGVPQCPRCWQYCGIPENYCGVCDRCRVQIKLGIPDYIKSGQITAEEGHELLEAILSSERAQVEKYRNGTQGIKLDNKTDL